MDLDSGKRLSVNNADHLLHPGKFLRHGQYLLGDILRSEGMVTTCRAVRLEQNQPVVIKSLSPAAHSSLNALFLADAQRVTQCQHPGLVKILDSFEEAGVAYVAMEFVPGQNLEDWIQSQGPLPEVQAVQYIRQVASALQVLHRQGLQHLNICPHSLVRPPTADFVVLTDCGFAQAAISWAELSTTSQPLVDYRALELNRPTAAITPATDIYALAATLYHLVTGQPPLAAPLRSRSPLVSPRQLQPHLSPFVETAILRGLDMDALARPQTLADWLALLQNPFASPIAPTLVQGNASEVTQPPREDGSRKPQSAPWVDSPQAMVPTPAPPELVAPGTALLTPIHSQPIAELASPRLPARKQPSQSKLSQSDRSTIAPFSFPSRPTLMKIATIASVVGVASGLVLRFSGGTGPGSQFFHTEQAFPTLSDWQSAAPPAAPPEAPPLPPQVPSRPTRTAPAATRRQPAVRTGNPVPVNSSAPRGDDGTRSNPPTSADSATPTEAPGKPRQATTPGAALPAASPPIADPPPEPVSAPATVPEPVPAPVTPATKELEPAPVN